MKKELTQQEAAIRVYSIIFKHLHQACSLYDVVAINNYIPQDTDEGTLKLAMQSRAAFLFVRQNEEKIELCLSDYVIYCDELNNRYELFGFNELTIA